MFIIDTPINIYSKSVITDLASRVGIAPADSVAPYIGMNHVVNQFWRDNNEIEIPMDFLFSQQKDFDSDICQPKMNSEEYNDSEIELNKGETIKPYSPVIDTTDFNKYYRRLEDIPYQYLETYMSNIIFTIRRQDGGGTKEFLSKHKVQPTLISMDDSGDFTELSDLLMDEDVNKQQWSALEKEDALKHLPYVIRRLHNLSCLCKIHMLSYISAYIKAKAKNEAKRNAGSTMILKNNAVIDEGVYLCDIKGNPKKRVTKESKNQYAQIMFDWINDAYPKWKGYYTDYVHYVHYCDILNIDILNDDMSKYGSEFAFSLNVSTVTPNDQYDKQVYDALLNSNKTLPIVAEKEVFPLENTINVLQQAITVNSNLKKYVDNLEEYGLNEVMSQAQSIHNIYNIRCAKLGNSDPNKYYFSGGLLYYNNDLVVLNANVFCEPDSQMVFNEPYCVISELGFVLHVTQYDFVDLITLNSALHNFMKLFYKQHADEKYNQWWRFSV